MSESDFYLLQTNKLYKKEDTKQLKNFPVGYVGVFTEIWPIILITVLIFFRE